MNPPTRKSIHFDRPAAYQIIVEGRVDPSMSDLLGGMSIQVNSGQVDPPATILRGELRDQAALAGVLNSLYELHMPVISVERLEIKL